MSSQNNNTVDEKAIMRTFIVSAQSGLCTKDELMEKHQATESVINDLNSRMAELKDVSERLEMASSPSEAYELTEKYGSQDVILSRYNELECERNQWAVILTELEALLNERKNFNKSLCFSNIRELLKQNPDVKIGQIEKAAGIRLGYMSRLEKEGNTAEPSMEFIVTAAKMLKVSIDVLISIDLTSLTPTERYIVNFFEKLKSDTIQDKLDWNIESEFNLNRVEPDINGFIYHPLFSEETFFEETECEYPEEVTHVVFSSKTFGPKTCISGDCFNLRLKNGTTLYLMDIEKSVHRVNDQFAFTKEAWMYVPHKGSQFLLASQSNSPIAPLLEDLFAVVKDRMEHPRVNNDVQYAIDAFMKDDLSDDITDEPPF